MKTKILTFLIIILSILGLVSCISQVDGETDKSNDIITYDISTSSFEVTDYDFQVQTSVNLKDNSKTKKYFFGFDAQCDYELSKYTANIEFYSLENKCIYERSVKKDATINANEGFKVSIGITEEAYNNAYSMRIYLSGESISQPKDNTNEPIIVKYLSISFLDDEYVLLQSRVKPGYIIEEKQITTPQKDGCAFYGWYLDKQLTESVKFPYKATANINLYADWLQTSYSSTCENAKLKDWTGNDSSASYNIMPTGFDYDKLEKAGYYIKLKVTYDVYYKKDYDVPFDVGYAGAPEYDAYILKTGGVGYGDSGLSTSKSTKTRTIELTLTPASFKNERLTLRFSTDNIQNLVYFKNIKVEYFCVK